MPAFGRKILFVACGRFGGICVDQPAVNGVSFHIQMGGVYQLGQTAVVVFVAVADQNKLKIGGGDTDFFNHCDQIFALAEPAGVHQKRFVGHYRIIPGRSQIPMTAVKVFGRQAENFKPGRQPEAHQHLVAAVIALMHNFNMFNQINILPLSSHKFILPCLTNGMGHRA